MINQHIMFGVIFVTITLLLLIAAIVVSFHIATKQRLEKDMKFHQAALDYEKEMRLAETAISESVLGHIGRELHDNVGHILTRLRLQLETGMLDEENMQLLQPMQQTLIAASDQLRLISRTLNAEYLNGDLVTAIRLETERLRILTNMPVLFDYDNYSLHINKEQQLLVFRIFQEAVSNILKYAKAKKIHIMLKAENDFFLSIQDDGIGFNRTFENENGIKNMIKRAELAQLSFKLTTSPQNGCNITIENKN